MEGNTVVIKAANDETKYIDVCAKDELMKGMQIVQPVIASKITLPVLSNFLFETEKDKIKLSATDLEIGVTCYIKAEVVNEGAITIPAKRFSDIITYALKMRQYIQRCSIMLWDANNRSSIVRSSYDDVQKGPKDLFRLHLMDIIGMKSVVVLGMTM